MKTVLSIAGSDCSGGAGIQADLKTMLVNGVFGMSVITAITSQNTIGVQSVKTLEPEVVASQLDSVFTDIRPDAVKIGMVSNIDTINVIEEKLRFYSADNIVLDPVMIATSNGRLIDKNAVEVLQERLFPLAKIITPNLFETEKLTNLSIKTKDDMEKAGLMLAKKFKTSFLIKGGHLNNQTSDFLASNQSGIWFEGIYIDNINTHGTGCTLSSAIASNLAKEFTLTEAVKRAKEYVTAAIKANLNLGHGRGPMNHFVTF